MYKLCNNARVSEWEYSTQSVSFPAQQYIQSVIHLLSLIETKHWSGSCEKCITLLIVIDSLIKLGVGERVGWAAQCRWSASTQPPINPTGHLTNLIGGLEISFLKRVCIQYTSLYTGIM